VDEAENDDEETDDTPAATPVPAGLKKRATRRR
jgi:hypothetical protein